MYPSAWLRPINLALNDNVEKELTGITTRTEFLEMCDEGVGDAMNGSPVASMLFGLATIVCQWFYV